MDYGSVFGRKGHESLLPEFQKRQYDARLKVTVAEREEMFINVKAMGIQEDSLHLFEQPLSQCLQCNPNGVLVHPDRVLNRPELGIVSQSQESMSSSGLVTAEVGLGPGEGVEELDFCRPYVSGNLFNDVTANVSMILGTLREHPEKLNCWLERFHLLNNEFTQMVRASSSDRTQSQGEYVSLLPASDTTKDSKVQVNPEENNRNRT